MTPTQLESQLKRWGINYTPYKSDWKTHNRGQRGEGWGNVHGLTIHHVGSDGDARADLYSGNSDLPGPKCQFYIHSDGVLWLIGWGRANHAGGGDPNVFQLIVDEDYSGTLKPHYHEGSPGAKDGNAYFYGVEVGYSGKHAMSAAQYRTLMLLCGAIAEFHNWSEKSFFAHGEWSDWKWDPGISNGQMMNMMAVRQDIKSIIKDGPKGSHVATGDGKKTPEHEPQVYKDLMHTDAFPKPKTSTASPDNHFWTLETLLDYIAVNSAEANKKLDKIMKHLGLD
jgi:hypothetical protein